MESLESWFQKHVIIQYRPIEEFLLSLHVLSKPKHHLSRIQWAENMIMSFPESMKADCYFFKNLSVEYLNILDMIPPWEERALLSIEAGLEKIEQLSDLEFIIDMIGYESDPITIQSLMKNSNKTDSLSMKPEIRELIKTPKKTKRRLLNFLYQYLNYFQKEQRRIEPWIIKAVHEGQQQIKKDPIAFIKKIHPRLTIHPTYVQFQKAKVYQFFYKDLKHIYVNPSTFVAPHLLLGMYADSISVGLHIEIPDTSFTTDIPLDFIKMMKALSDPKRLAILKSLLEHPYSIQQLADIHQISSPAITKHINLLKEVELIWGERRGYYVFYQGVPERLEMLTVEIHQFLDMSNPNPKQKE